MVAHVFFGVLGKIAISLLAYGGCRVGLFGLNLSDYCDLSVSTSRTRKNSSKAGAADI